MGLINMDVDENEIERLERILACNLSKSIFQAGWINGSLIGKEFHGKDTFILVYNDTFGWAESYGVCFISLNEKPLHEQLNDFILENDLENSLKDFRENKWDRDKEDSSNYFERNIKFVQPLLKALDKRHGVDKTYFIEEVK